MKILQSTVKIRAQTGKSRTKATLLALSAIAFTLTGTHAPNAWGQTPEPQQLKKTQQNWRVLLNSIPSFKPNSTISKRPVRLDGRELFQVALITPGRVDSIENNLQQAVTTDTTSQNFKVTVELDRQTQQPIIQVNGQYLLTVTNADAPQGIAPLIQAKQWQEVIEKALLEAYLERQSNVLKQRAILAGGILLVIILASWQLSKLQRRLKTQQVQIREQTPPPLTDVLPAPADPADNSSQNTATQPEPITVLHKKITHQQQHNLNDIKQRLLQVAQLAIWGGGTYLNLGLFPYSRWLQPLIVSALKLPLQLLVVGVIVYVIIRLSAVLIDRFFTTLEDGARLDPDASRRLALRFSTFSVVFKSLIWAGSVSLGVLVGLAVIGIDIGPILAGAGIIGLAVSFASQSLIKDTINGFLILLEDQYAVGDVIVVGDVSGLVEYMNLRITQLRNGEGRLITIPNSAISIVQNLSKDWARVDLTVDLAYHTNVDEALAVIKTLADQLYNDPQWNDKIIEAPEVLGIDEIDHAGILVRIWIKVKPLQHWSVAREFRRRLKQTFDRAGISIGAPQQALLFRNSLDLRDGHNAKNRQRATCTNESFDSSN